jgi:hypothetical protein
VVCTFNYETVDHQNGGQKVVEMFIIIKKDDVIISFRFEHREKAFFCISAPG